MPLTHAHVLCCAVAPYRNFGEVTSSTKIAAFDLVSSGMQSAAAAAAAAAVGEQRTQCCQHTSLM
jgi:hypothetical protein